MRKLCMAALCAAGVLCAGQAGAVTVVETFTGTIASGVDTDGRFGEVGADLTGDPFSVTFSFEGVASPGLIDALGGPIFSSPLPPNTVALSIDGQDAVLDVSNLGLAGGSVSYARTPTPHNSPIGQVGFSLFGAAFSLEINTTERDPSVSGGVITVTNDLNLQPTLGSIRFTGEPEIFFTDVVATASPVPDLIAAGVPEPAAWALMIAGFGLAGAALRRRNVAA